MKLKLVLNRKFKTCLLTVLGILTFGFLHAQTINVSGIVSDEQGPLPGVSVVIKGTTTGTTTDFDGLYTIEAGSSDVLRFSYIGYADKEIPVAGKTTINVTLEEDVSALDEVVVIGYGTSKRKDLTGSIVSVKSEDLNKVKPVSFEQGLASKASGVQVIASEGGPGSGSKN